MTTFLSRMAELLQFHGLIRERRELSHDNLSLLITRFQKKHGLFADGIPGPLTCWALQEAWVHKIPPLDLVTCVADKAPGSGGYGKVVLRADAAAAFQEMASKVRGQGGLVTTSGGVRALKSEVTANRSQKSLHYCGLAFDLGLDTGFTNPEKDPFVLTRQSGEERPYFRVWARTGQGGVRTLEAMVWGGKSEADRVVTVTGSFLDFTALAGNHGFAPISPRVGFFAPTKRDYMAAEWWHFQYQAALIPNLSQFGIELLRIKGYTEKRIIQENPGVWENRREVFGRGWG